MNYCYILSVTNDYELFCNIISFHFTHGKRVLCVCVCILNYTLAFNLCGVQLLKGTAETSKL